MGLNIVCAVDDKLYHQLLCKAMIISLVQNSKLEDYKIFVLHDGQDSSVLEELSDIITICPVKSLDIICGTVKSRTTYARLEIPFLKPLKNKKRLLYLDIDTYCLGDLRLVETFQFNVAAMVNPGGQHYMKIFFTIPMKL